MRLFVLAFAVCLGAAQPASTTFTLDRAIAIMADYGRGVTEVQFDVPCTVTSTNRRKRPTTEKTRHVLEGIKGRFGGPGDSAQAPWAFTWKLSAASSFRGDFQLFADGVLLQPLVVFDPGQRQDWMFQPSPGAIAYRSAKPCSTPPLVKNIDAFRIGNCGAGEVAETPDGGLRIHFEALGLPAQAGKDTLNAFRADGELASVTLPGGGKPFLFPKHSLSTYVFTTGSDTIDCTYQMRQQKGRK